MRTHADPVSRLVPGGDQSARRAGGSAVAFASAVGNRRMGAVLARVPAGSVAARPGRARRRSAARTAGGSILYVGMNNFAPELRRLGQRYRGGLRSVTVTSEEHDAKIRGVRYDLTGERGLAAFVESLPVDSAQRTALLALLGRTADASREEIARLASVFALADRDHDSDQLSRIVLSGHSNGSSIFSGDATGGAVEFAALRTLASIFPRAARQTRHLIVIGCFAGEEGVGNAHYRQIFPNLQTWWSWWWKAPTGAEAARTLAYWARLTDADPTRLPMPPRSQANWSAEGGYQRLGQTVDRSDKFASLRADESELFAYFDGSATDSGRFLLDYYGRARLASQAAEAGEADRLYAHQHAEQAYRLRFWPAMVAHFWERNEVAIQKGYGSVPAPDFGTMSRGEAVAAYYAFNRTARGSERDRAEAHRLLHALYALDAAELDYRWIEPPARTGRRAR